MDILALQSHCSHRPLALALNYFAEVIDSVAAVVVVADFVVPVASVE